MIRNESFYKRYFGEINIEILKQIEDIKANKGNKTAEFWEDKLKFCQRNNGITDIKSLKQAIVRNSDCPTFVVEELLLFELDKDIMFDSLNRNDINDPKLINYILSNITDARIKREFKHSIQENRSPQINRKICQHMAENCDPERFDGYPFRYCLESEKIRELLQSGELPENALTEIINNDYMSTELKQQAFETSFNYTRLTNPTNDIVQDIFDSATSTIYDFDSSDSTLKEARIKAHNTLNYLIENNLLNDVQEMELYDKVIKDADKGNSQTNNAFMRRLLTKTKCNYLLDTAFIEDIYKNPKVNPTRVVFIISSVLANELKYKKAGSPAFINALGKIRTYYDNYRYDKSDNSKLLQQRLIEFLQKNESNNRDSSVWVTYLTMANSIHTLEEHLKYIEGLYPKHQEALKASFVARLNLELRKMKSEITDEQRLCIIKYSSKLDSEYPKINIDTNKEIQSILDNILEEGKFKSYKKHIKDFKKALEEMEEDYELFGKIPRMFAKDGCLNCKTYSGYAFCANSFMKMSEKEKEDFYNTLGEKQIKRLRTVIQNQMKNQIDKVEMYMNMVDMAESSTKLLDMLKDKTDYYKTKENAEDREIKSMIEELEL